MEFNFKPKVAGAGSFTPPPGYQLIDNKWVNTADVFDESITTMCSTKENDMNENTPECSDAAEATECTTSTTTESACSTTTEVVNAEAAEATGCSETATA